MDSALPHLNALLNFMSACFLLLGFKAIKSGRIERHRVLMCLALVSSTFFLVFYLIHHANVGSVPYLVEGWSRYLYFSILIPHVILAALMVPFIIALLYRISRGDIDGHKRLARWVWPVWMFVSVSGIIVYVMVYQLNAPAA